MKPPRLRSAEERAFHSAVNRLNVLLERVRRRLPQAEYYLSPGGLHFMSGPSHDELHQPHRERSMAVGALNADGGDW